MFLNSFVKLSLVTSLALSISTLSADEFDDDGFGGGEDIKIVKTKKKEDYSIYGNIKASTSYNTQKNKSISSAKLSTNTHFDYDINDDIKFKSTLNAYIDDKTDIKDDHDIDLNEAYIQAKISSKVDFTIGRQIVAWGKSDNIRITDTINPMDLSTPGMTDIKDLRLGRFMSKLDYATTNNWDISAIVLHENRYSKMPQNGSEYIMPNQFPNEPSNSLKNTGLAFSGSTNMQGADLSVYASNDYIDNKDYKTNMLGFAYNIVKDSFLFKVESAYFDNYDNDTIKSKIDVLGGVEYKGISDATISFDIANKDNQIQYAIRATQSYLNQTLDLTFLYNGYGKNLDEGGFVRIWADYDLNDKFTSSFGVINYLSSDVPNYFEMIKNNDRVFASMAYNF